MNLFVLNVPRAELIHTINNGMNEARVETVSIDTAATHLNFSTIKRLTYARPRINCDSNGGRIFPM